MNRKILIGALACLFLIGCGSDNNSSSSKGVFSSLKEDYSKITPVAVKEYEASKFDAMKKEIFNPENDSNPSRKSFDKKDLRMFALNYIDNVSKPKHDSMFDNSKNIKFINFFEDGDSEIIKRVFLQYFEYDEEFLKFISKVYEKGQDGNLNKTYVKTRKIIEENIFELASLNKQKSKLLETFYEKTNKNKENMDFDHKKFIANFNLNNIFMLNILKDEQIKTNAKELLLGIFKDELKMSEYDYQQLKSTNGFKIIFENTKNISFTDKEIESFMKKSFIPNAKIMGNKSITEYYEKNKEKINLEAKNEMRENIKTAIASRKFPRENFRYIPAELLDDNDLMEYIIETKKYSPVLSYVSPRLKNDKNFVLKAIIKDSYEYEYISSELKNDTEIVSKMIEQYKVNKNYNLGPVTKAGNDVKTNKDIIIELLKLEVFGSESFPKEMYKNDDVLYYMLKRYEQRDSFNNYHIEDKWRKYASDELKSKYKTPRDFLEKYQIN